MPSTASNALNVSSTGLVKFDGTATFTAATVTNHATLVGGASNAITSLALGSSGDVLTSNGAGADPSFQTLTVVTAASTLTDNAIVRGDGGARGVQTSTPTVSDAGEMVNTSQPAWLDYLGSNVTNATGDGTVFTIGSGTALTEVFDQGGNMNTNGTFTAPVTGRYQMACGVLLANVGAAHTTFVVSLVTSNRTYQGNDGSPTTMADANQNVRGVLAALTDMDSADTATCTVSASGGTKIVTVGGSSTVGTFFGGYLAC